MRFFIILTVICFSMFVFSSNKAIAKEFEFKGATLTYMDEDLILARTLSELKCSSVKKGDIFKFKVLEDVNYKNRMIIPDGSTVEAKVTKVRKKFFLRSDAYVEILLTSITTVDNEAIDLEDDKIKLRITSPYYRTASRKILQRSPVVALSTGSSIPLGITTGWHSGIIAAISAGAGAVGGAISGFIDPEMGKSRINCSLVRAVEGTPFGTVLITVGQGHEVNFPAQCHFVIRIDENIKKEIAGEMERIAEASHSSGKKF